MTKMNAMASSKQGQSSTGDGYWLTGRQAPQSKELRRNVSKDTLLDINGVPLRPLLVTHRSTSGITIRCNTHPIIPSMIPMEMPMNSCIPVYSLPPAIDKTYNTSTITQVASAAVDRGPARWRSWRCAPRNSAKDTQIEEWVEGNPYYR